MSSEFQMRDRWLRAVLLCAWSLVNSSAMAQGATLESSTPSYAAIESAEYEATFSEGDFIDGSLRWQLLHRGTEPSVIEITKSNLAISELRLRGTEEGQKEAIWGTTNENRRVVILDPQTKVLQGSWSLHGRRFPGRMIFDFSLPPALNSLLKIKTPSELFIQSSAGIVKSEFDKTQSDFRIWTIDLGRNQTFSLTLTNEDIPEEIIHPKVDVEEVHVARQDGIFVQTDFTIDGLDLERNSEIEILTPTSLVLQSVTSNSVPLSYGQNSSKRKSIRIILPEAVSGTRVNLRIQGFRPVRWVRKQTLPSLKLVGGIEAKRITSLRVESPLELHSVDRQGYFQSGLTKEPRGEIWRFEAYEENAKLIVDLGQPRYSLKAGIHSLHYLDTPLPWVVSKLTTSVKSGRLFEQNIEIPADWIIVSVLPLNVDSEISSWSVNQHQVEISFKEPISSDSVKTVQILARCPRPPLQLETPFPVPVVIDATTTAIQSDWIISADNDVELSSTTHWSKLTSEINFTQFVNLPAFTELSRNQTRRSFFNSNFNRETLPSFRVFPHSELQSSSIEEETSIDQEESLPDSTALDLPLPAADLHIMTQAESLDNEATPRLVHHATIAVLGTVSPQHFVLQLDEDSLLSSVTVDGKAVTVFREGNNIKFPEEIQSLSEVTLIYVTTTQRGFFKENCRIPLPEHALEVRSIDWTLDLPAERKLTSTTLAGVKRVMKSERSFFGPLTSNWRLSSSGDDQKSFSRDTKNETKRYQFYALEVSSELRFEAWDTKQTLSLSWVVFLTCTLIGVGGRLLKSTIIYRSSPYWLLLLIVMQLWMVNEYSLLGGAMLAGTLLSMLFPIDLLRLTEISANPAPVSRLATASLLLCLSLSQFSMAQNPSAAASYSADESIRYLLRSVNYELLSSTPLKLYQAKIEVLTPRENQETLIELPYQGVVFQSGAECLVDGQTQSLIPAVSGTGVVVRIPQKSQEESTVEVPFEGLHSNWTSHIIQFEFILKDQAGATPESTVPVVKFPVIQNSVLTLNSSLETFSTADLQAFDRKGQLRQTGNGMMAVDLGPISTLMKPTFPEETLNSESPLYTSLNISSARISGQLFISKEKVADLNQLILRLPNRALITNVSGPGIAQWFTSTDQDAVRNLIVEFKNKATDKDCVVTFYLPTTSNTVGEVVVPELGWGGSFKNQFLGIKAANGIEVEIVPEQIAVEEVATELWPQNELLGRSRPSQILRLNRDHPVRLSLREITPTTTHSFAETLTVTRTSLNWKADVEIDVVDIPTFVHHFMIDGGLRIASVKNIGAGENALLRFHQSGRRLSVFFPGGQLGGRKLGFSGEMRFTPETLGGIPRVELDGSELLRGTFTILDQTNWDIELAMPGGTTLSRKSLPAEKFTGERSIGVFSSNSSNRPAQIELLPPPSATRVDIASRVQVDGIHSWNCVQLLHFSGDATPLKNVTFRAPKKLGKIRIGPRYFKSQMTELNDETEYVIKVPDRFSNEVTIQVYSKLSESVIQEMLDSSKTGPSSELPGVRITSARTVSQYLFFNKNKYVTTPALEALPVERKNLPEWIPLQWKEALTNMRLLSYQIIDGNPQFIADRVEQADQTSTLRFAETLVWPTHEGTAMGRTRFWLTGSQRFSFRLPFQKFVKVKRAYQSNAEELTLTESNGETFAEVASAESVIPIEIYWEVKSAERTGGLQFLVPDSDQSFPNLIGFINEQAQSDQGMSQLDKLAIDAVLARWDALLEIAKSMQVPIAVESSIYRDLQKTNSLVNELLAEENLTIEQRHTIETLTKNWSDISSQLTISAGPVIANTSAGNLSAGLLWEPQNQLQSVRWSLSGSPVVHPEHKASEFQNFLPLILKFIVLLGGGILIFYFKETIRNCINSVGKSPVLRLLLIGSLWFFFMQPVVIGFIFIALALTIQVSKGAASGRMPSDQDIGPVA